MSNYFEVLEKGIPATPLFTEPAQVPVQAAAVAGAGKTRGVYVELIQALFGARPGGERSVIAFTSGAPKAGVTRVVHAIGRELAGYTERNVVIAESAALYDLRPEDLDRIAYLCCPTHAANLFVLAAGSGGGFAELLRPERQTAPWQTSAQFRADCMKALREAFRYVLLDVPSISASGDAALLGGLADGMVLVLEAGRTKNDDVIRARRAIEHSGGALLGCVLNKRTYPVPGWLHRLLK